MGDVSPEREHDALHDRTCVTCLERAGWPRRRASASRGRRWPCSAWRWGRCCSSAPSSHWVPGRFSGAVGSSISSRVWSNGCTRRPCPPRYSPNGQKSQPRTANTVHVRASGTFLNDSETLVQATTELGAGYLGADAAAAGRTGRVVLVNRGFVPPERRERVAHGAAEPTTAADGHRAAADDGAGRGFFAPQRSRRQSLVFARCAGDRGCARAGPRRALLHRRRAASTGRAREAPRPVGWSHCHRLPQQPSGLCHHLVYACAHGGRRNVDT